MQTEIDSRRAARGRQNIAFVLVEHILNHVDVWITGFKRVDVAPVGCGFAAVQQPRSGQHKYPRTDGEQPASSRAGLA